MFLTRRNFLKRGGLCLAGLAFKPFSGISFQPGPLQEATNLLKNLPALTSEDFAIRREKALRLLAEHKFDAIFIGGGTNLVYLTNVSWWLSERVFGVLLSRKKEPIWVCPAFEVKRAEELIPPGQEIRTWEEHENPYEIIKGILKDIGLATGRLATAPDLRAFEVYGLRRALPTVEIVDGAPVTEGCRAIKSEKEIAFMEAANRLTKMAYREAFKANREGISQSELGAEFRAAH